MHTHSLSHWIISSKKVVTTTLQQLSTYPKDLYAEWLGTKTYYWTNLKRSVATHVQVGNEFHFFGVYEGETVAAVLIGVILCNCKTFVATRTLYQEWNAKVTCYSHYSMRWNMIPWRDIWSQHLYCLSFCLFHRSLPFSPILLYPLNATDIFPPFSVRFSFGVVLCVWCMNYAFTSQFIYCLLVCFSFKKNEWERLNNEDMMMLQF